jgi:hypothetical protein
MKAWGKTLDPSGKSGVRISILFPFPSYRRTSRMTFGFINFQTAADIIQIRFLADPTVAFTKALDLSFDGSSIFGGDRSKRYALVVKDGKIKEVHVEPDNTGLNGESLSPLYFGTSTCAMTDTFQCLLPRRSFEYNYNNHVRNLGPRGGFR